MMAPALCDLNGAYWRLSSLSLNIVRDADGAAAIQITVNATLEGCAYSAVIATFAGCVDIRLLGDAVTNPFVLDITDIADRQIEHVAYQVRDIEEEVLRFQCRAILLDAVAIPRPRRDAGG